MAATAGQDDLMEQGFHLAYFIFPSRAVAIRILTDALNKLKAQRGRENRRAYWRDKYLKRSITRITREEGDALQWLIFFESDRYEKEQETSGNPSAQDLAVRYIKNLVRMTTAMSSFHVNVGLHRLLHNYSTSETQRTYETVTERFLGADEYRRAKSVLMNKLGQRFRGSLKIVRTQHGELRFEELEDQQSWRALVEACLRVFVPWSTRQQCPVPAGFDPEKGKILPQLSETAAAPLGHDQVEIRRCHVFIDPVCYTRLAAALALDSPEQRLALPRFFMENTRGERPSPQPPALSGDERSAIRDQLSNQSSRRSKARIERAKVFVDGQEHAQLDLTRKNQNTFVVEEGSELIEIKGVDQAGELLLATQPVPYSAGSGILSSDATVFLHGGKRLSLSFAPLTERIDHSEQPRHAVVRVSHEPLSFTGFLTEPWSKHRRWLSALGYAAVAAALVALGWIGGTETSLNRGKAAYNSFLGSIGQKQPQVAPSVASPQNVTALVSEPMSKPPRYKLVPDDWIVRGAGGPEMPTIAIPAKATMIALELPTAAEGAHRQLRALLRPLQEQVDILSEILTKPDTTSPEVATVFWVPSTILHADRDYTVVLQSKTPSGRFQEIGGYTFRTATVP